MTKSDSLPMTDNENLVDLKDTFKNNHATQKLTPLTIVTQKFATQNQKPWQCVYVIVHDADSWGRQSITATYLSAEGAAQQRRHRATTGAVWADDDGSRKPHTATSWRVDSAKYSHLSHVFDVYTVTNQCVEIVTLWQFTRGKWFASTITKVASTA